MKYFFPIIIAVVLIGCGVTQPVRPIEAGTTELTASLGGPIAPVSGIAIPLPYLNSGILYGYSNDLTWFGNAHLTALLFKNIAFDGGFMLRFVKEDHWIPDVSARAQCLFFWNAFRTSDVMRFYPVTNITMSYKIGERSLAYFGSDVLFQLHNNQHEEFVSPFFGYQFPFSDKLQGQVECKWMAVNKNTRHGIFEGAASINGRGNAGLFFGLSYQLGK
jgi:hypothetical protein